VTLAQPFCEVAKRFEISNSAPYRDIPRTWDSLLRRLWDWFKANPTALISTASDFSGYDSEMTENNQVGGLTA
jgi:hypothetical protein